MDLIVIFLTTVSNLAFFLLIKLKLTGNEKQKNKNNKNEKLDLKNIRNLDVLDVYLLTGVFLASTFHHLTTTSHDIISPYSEFHSFYWLWFDRLFAFLAILKCVYSFIIVHKFHNRPMGFLIVYFFPAIIGIISLLVSDVYYHHCTNDFDKLLYGISHSIWHICAAFTYFQLQLLKPHTLKKINNNIKKKYNIK